MRDDDRYDPLIKNVLDFCLENMEERWQWCSENVDQAFTSYDLLARGEDYLAAELQSIKDEYEYKQRVARQEYADDLEEAQANVSKFSEVIRQYMYRFDILDELDQQLE